MSENLRHYYKAYFDYVFIQSLRSFSKDRTIYGVSGVLGCKFDDIEGSLSFAQRQDIMSRTPLDCRKTSIAEKFCK
jgi:hypothetical protein